MESVIETRVVYSVGDVTIRVMMVADEVASPLDADCYSAEDIESWRQNGWEYVGLVASVTVCGVELGTDSLWSIEYGWLGGDVHTNAWDMAPEVIGPALDDAIATGAKLQLHAMAALADAKAWEATS